MAKRKDELQELLNKAYEPPRNGPQCWVTRIPDEAQEFLAAVDSKTQEVGQPPTYTHVRKILAEHFGVNKANDSIRHHLQHRCRCFM